MGKIAKVVVGLIAVGVIGCVVTIGTAPVTAQSPRKNLAACFSIEGLRASVYDSCRRSSCLTVKLTGELKNGCDVAAGAEVQIVAKDAAGNIVDVISHSWPASTQNIAPGQRYAFDLGPLIDYRPDMKNFSMSITNARTWR